jgi:hypothetical protein
MSMKNPLTPAGIEPATFRFVAQHTIMLPWGNVREWRIKEKVFTCIRIGHIMYTVIQSYMFDSNCSM